MPYSYVVYTGNGSTTQFAITFPYIRKEHVKVYVNYVDTAYTYVNDTTVQLAAAPASPLRVEVRRVTPLSTRLVDYTDGSTLVAADLDTSNLQSLYNEQELDDNQKRGIFVDDATGLITAGGQRITSVANPVNAQDAATKTYVDTADALKVAKAGDSMTGALAMGTNKITGLGNPTSAQDAATKTYVDTADALKVAKAGDTMSGALAMGTNKITGMGDPTSAQDAATKTYVDTADALKVAKAGDTMSGALAMGSNKITGLGTPTANADAATKLYVDTVTLAGNVPDGDRGDITVSGVGTSWAIDAGAVVEAKLGTGAVTETKLGTGAVVEAKLGTGAVTETKLGTGAVTETKLGTGAVTSTKILDGTILNADVNATAGIVASKLSFTQAGASAVARTVDSKLKDVVSVKDFGAVGDGVTDDTTAINNALAASNTIFFPVGTYLTNGNHNIKAKSLEGEDKYRSIIKLSGSNTNTSLLINGHDINTAWGSGGGCNLYRLSFHGNWDGSTSNAVTNISNIGALFKWWAGAGVQIVECNFFNNFGFGIFSYQLGYSYINQTDCKQHGKNGIHLQSPNGNVAITSTSISDCVIQSCRGRSVDAATGGSGLNITNGFQVKVYNCTLEDLDDGIRLAGSDNRSNTFIGNHIESISTSCFNYVVSGTDLLLLNNIFAASPSLLNVNTQFTDASVLGNFGAGNVLNLEKAIHTPGQQYINAAAPKTIIAQLTLGPGTWQLTGNWTGVHAGGAGSVSSKQTYAINTTASIPGFSIFFNAAVLNGQITSPTNEFIPLQGTLALSVTITASTTYYLYGGPESISSTLSCVLDGTLQATLVSTPYYY